MRRRNKEKPVDTGAEVIENESIIKAVEFPGLTFKSKEELFKHLKENEDRLIDIKKSIVYKGAEKGGIKLLSINNGSDSIEKSAMLGLKEGNIYPIISTTNYLDSHNDVHFNGSMNKTAREQNGNVMYALDHELKYDSILAWAKDVNMMIKDVEWSSVGKEYKGTTQALIFEIKEDAIRNKQVLSDIKNNVTEFQNSIRMIYHKVVLGVDSDDKDFKANKKYFDRKINDIVNNDIVKERGYFWGVEELGIQKEGSLVVAGGSNDATSILHNETEPSNKDTQEDEPLKNTQIKRRRRY